MKKLLDQVNQDIQSNNLEGAIQRVQKFLTINTLLIKEKGARSAELRGIETSHAQLAELEGKPKYDHQALLISQIQSLADRIIKRKLWPAVATILGLIATITGIITFFWPDINTKNTDCPIFDKDKCSLVITNFSSQNPDDANFIAGQLLLGINDNNLLKDKVSITRAIKDPYNLEGTEVAVRCIEDCKNKFSIYGSYFPGRLELKYKIINEDGESATPEDNFVYQISELGLENLQEEMIEAKNGADVVINSICVACEIQKIDSQIYAKLAAEAPDNKSKQAVFHAAQLSYLKDDNLEKAIMALDHIEEVEDNKYAVFALEKSSSLAMQMNNFEDGFDRQSRYIQKVSGRLQDPTRYNISRQAASYQTALTKMRENRGMNVYDHVEEMKISDSKRLFMIQTAISDLETVGPLKFQKEIRELIGKEELLGGGTTIQQKTLRVRLKDQASGANLRDATVIIGGQELIFSDGVYLISGNENQFIGQQLTIKKDGFQTTNRNVASVDLDRGLNIDLAPNVKSPIHTISIQLRDTLTNRIIKNGMVQFDNSTITPNTRQIFEISGTREFLLGKKVFASAQDFGRQSKVIRESDLEKGLLFMLVKESNWQLEIEPFDARTGKRIIRAFALLNQRQFEIDQTGGFLIDGTSDELLNQTILITAEKYEPKKFLIEKKHLNQRTKTGLIPSPVEEISKEYHIKGRITFCNNLQPKMNSVIIDGQKIQVQKDLTFHTVLHRKPGSTAKLEINNKYEMVLSSQSKIEFGDNPSIDFRLPIKVANFKSTRIIVTGTALSNGKPMYGAYLSVVGQKNSGMLLPKNGIFKVIIPWNKQCESFKLSARSEGWGSNESDLIYPAASYNGKQTIALGNVKFKYIGVQID